MVVEVFTPVIAPGQSLEGAVDVSVIDTKQLKKATASSLSKSALHLSWGSVILKFIGKALFLKKKVNLSKVSAGRSDVMLAESDEMDLALRMLPPTSGDSSAARPEKTLTRFKFSFSLKIPSDIVLPVSYVGNCVRFIYFLSVGVADSSGKALASDIKIPITFLCDREWSHSTKSIKMSMSQDLVFASDDSGHAAVDKSSAATSPDHSFVEVNHPSPRETDLEEESIMKEIQALISMDEQELNKQIDDLSHSEVTNLLRSPSKTFNISAKDSTSICQMFLDRSRYSLGEHIHGVLDFSDSGIPCYRV